MSNYNSGLYGSRDSRYHTNVSPNRGKYSPKRDENSPGQLNRSIGGQSHKSKKDQNYYVNEKEAKAIARRIFDHYDRDRSGVIESDEMVSMLLDAYKGINNHFTPNSNQIDSYMKVVDRNSDGIVTIEDIERTVIKYLCSLDEDFGYHNPHTHYTASHIPDKSPYTS